MKKQLKTAEEMAELFRDRTVGKGLNSQETSDVLTQVMREGGYEPNDKIRAQISTAYKVAYRSAA